MKGLEQILFDRFARIVFLASTLVGGCSAGHQVLDGAASEQSSPAVAAIPAASERPSGSAPQHETVRISAGTYTFGASETQFEYYLKHSLVNFPRMTEKLRQNLVIPQRKVYLDDFQIDRFEATNKDYREFLAATGYAPANRANYLKHWEGATTYPEWAAAFPVVWISREDAEAYCKWRGARLPTEEEWEKAARGADGRYFPWGDDFPQKETANFGTDRAEPVGNRPGDRSPYDVYDLGANVAEITSTTIKDMVVVRGGNFLAPGRDTATFKRTLTPSAAVRSVATGCRCALTP